MVSQAMELLSFRHDRAYLTTHSKSLAAIKIYLAFGFLPYIREDMEQKEWVEITKRLGTATSIRQTWVSAENFKGGTCEKHGHSDL